MRICMICDTLHPDGTDQCKECNERGELIPIFLEKEKHEQTQNKEN